MIYYTEKIFLACTGFISLALSFCVCIELCQAFVEFWGSKNIFSAFLVDFWCFLLVSRREDGLFPLRLSHFMISSKEQHCPTIFSLACGLA